MFGYLIVIDDVWSVRAWEAIQFVLPTKNSCGGRVVVTTRIESVAAKASVSGEYIYHIQRLSQDDSRKLFLSRAFGSIDAQCPGGLETTMESILRKCGGLPLAIISIASVLAGYTSSESKEKWETLCRSIGSQMEMHPTLEGMSRILTLSFNHLPHELKSCMMYLSIFPEDYAIRKDRLVHKWIAEGLVPEKRGLTLLEVAESYYDELLSRNMIFSVKGQNKYWQRQSFEYDGKEECCQVHDMLLEVVVSMSMEYNFVSLLGGQHNGMSYDRIRRLSIHEHEDMDNTTSKMHIRADEGMMSVDLQQHVRSLSMFQVYGNKLLLDQLGKFTLLRVLDLEGCKGVNNKHVRYACRLHLLKFLSFKDTNIEKVPPQISNLEHLQTLDLRGTKLYRNDCLPTTVTKLQKLERLSISTWWLPQGLSSMKALREVACACLGKKNVHVARELGTLEQLQELMICVDSMEGNNKEAFVQAVGDSLSKLCSLRSLDIQDRYGALECLYRLQEPPRLLRHLCIHGAMDHHHRLPAWISSLTYLVEIVLTDVENLRDDEPFGVLCKLPSLQSIRMELECYSGDELVARSSHSFPALVNLHMEIWGDTTQAYRFEAGSMPKLERLSMYFNQSNNVRIVGIEHLTSELKQVQLIGRKTCNAFNRAVEQLKAESARREAAGSSQFHVIIITPS